MVGKRGAKQGIEREVLACLRHANRAMTAAEVAATLGRNYGSTRGWLDIHCRFDPRPVEHAGKRGAAQLYRLRDDA